MDTNVISGDLLESNTTAKGAQWKKEAFKKAGKFVAAANLAAGAALVQAADHSTAINAAYTDGNTNVGAAVTGVIALVAIVTGLGLIVGILRR